MSRLSGWLSLAPSRWQTEDVAVQMLARSASGIAFSISLQPVCSTDGRRTFCWHSATTLTLTLDLRVQLIFAAAFALG